MVGYAFVNKKHDGTWSNSIQIEIFGGGHVSTLLPYYPIKDEINGAANHILFLSLSKILTSISWAIMNAVPEPIAILTEIKSEKFVEN